MIIEQLSARVHSSAPDITNLLVIAENQDGRCKAIENPN